MLRKTVANNCKTIPYGNLSRGILKTLLGMCIVRLMRRFLRSGQAMLVQVHRMIVGIANHEIVVMHFLLGGHVF